MVNQLHRWALDPTSRAYYDEILDALSTFSPKVKLPGGLDHSEAFDVFRLVLHDNPRIIWADTSARTIGCHGSIVGMEFEYLRDEASARRELDKVARLVNPLLDEACEHPAGLERVVAVHDGLLALNAGTDGGTDLRNALGALGLSRGGAVCSGFARAFKMLSDAANIPCAVVSGWAASGGRPKPTRDPSHTTHAWNLVDVSTPDRPSQWVHVDAYWDAEEGGWPFHHAYLGLSDKEVSATHLIAANGFCPSCDESALYYRSFGAEPRHFWNVRPALRKLGCEGGGELRLPSPCPEEFEACAKDLIHRATQEWRCNVRARLIRDRQVILLKAS